MVELKRKRKRRDKLEPDQTQVLWYRKNSFTRDSDARNESIFFSGNLESIHIRYGYGSWKMIILRRGIERSRKFDSLQRNAVLVGRSNLAGSKIQVSWREWSHVRANLMRAKSRGAREIETW